MGKIIFRWTLQQNSATYRLDSSGSYSSKRKWRSSVKTAVSHRAPQNGESSDDRRNYQLCKRCLLCAVIYGRAQHHVTSLMLIHHKPYTIHHRPHTIHHAPYTMHHTPYTMHNTPYTIHHAPYTMNHSPYTIHHAPYTIHHAPCTINHIPYTIHHIQYTIHHAQYTIHHAPYTIHHTPRTPFARHFLTTFSPSPSQ